MEDVALTQAIVAYTGKGRSPFPRTDEAAVRALGCDDALVARAVGIFTECMQVDVDWSTHSLVEGGRAAHAAIAQRYPELGDEALEAMFWAFTYKWR